jgi:hypothetical protein
MCMMFTVGAMSIPLSPGAETALLRLLHDNRHNNAHSQGEDTHS